MSTVVPLEQVSTIVTDASADPDEIERIERGGVEVVIATAESTAMSASQNGRGRLADIRGQV